MKRQKIRNTIIREVMTRPAGADRNAQVDYLLATHLMSADENALKAICRQGGGAYIYW